jgi:hypothetical protein
VWGSCDAREYLDGVVDVDEGVGIAENTEVACGNVGHVSSGCVLVDYFAQLVLQFFK